MQEASSSHIGLKPAVVMRKQQDNEVAARETVSADQLVDIALAAQVWYKNKQIYGLTPRKEPP
jgi:hypothetical protein